MRPLPVRTLLAAPVAAALLLGFALLGLAAVVVRTLGERDAAVRQGILLRLGHELEADLREGGPEQAGATLPAFLAAHGDELAGVELAGASGAVLREGEIGRDAVEQPAMLGPAWRGVFGQGGRGGGPGAGRATPARLRLQPAPGLGGSRVGTLVAVGAVAAAIVLVAFSLLATTGLAQRQRLAAANAERQRLEAVALAGAGLAHRIRGPLAAAKGSAQLLQGTGTPVVEGRASRIVEACERIEALVTRLLTYARPPEPSPEALDLAALAARVVARTAGPVRVTGEPGLAAWADADHTESILEELLANARAFDAGGTLEVEVAREGRWASLAVADRGPGPALDPERAFDPYVSSRPEGTGLGLAIVRALARANGGDVTLAPRPGGGSVARLLLPAEGD